MGLPKILIEFKTLAESLIKRSERGIVAVILKDGSNGAVTNTYSKESEIVKSHYTTTNLNYLSLIFKGNPSKVIVERIPTNGDWSDALDRLKNKKWTYLTIPGIQDAQVSDVAQFIVKQREDEHSRNI